MIVDIGNGDAVKLAEAQALVANLPVMAKKNPDILEERSTVKAVALVRKHDPGMVERMEKDLTVASPEPEVPGEPWPAPLQEPAFYGLAGEVVRTIEPHTEADSAAILIQTLVAFGNVVGRTPHAVAEADEHFGNLFAVLVGVSSKGRKGTSWGRVRRLFNSVDDLWVADRIRDGLSSGEGLIYEVRDRRESEDGDVLDEGVKDKRLLVMEGEFARVLKVISREGNTLSSVGRSAWDTGALHTMTKNTPLSAKGAHISIIGHITKAELKKTLSETDAANGFGNRFLWICSKRSKYLPEGGNLSDTELSSLASRVQAAAQAARRTFQIKRDDEARARWRQEYPRLSDGAPGLLGSMTARAEAQVLRLSVLYALLDQSKEIRLPHLEAALEVWRYAFDSARFIFGACLASPDAEKIMKALDASGGKGLTKTEIFKIFAGHRRAQQIRDALAALLDTGLVRRETERTEGRDAERWYSDAISRSSANAKNAKQDKKPKRPRVTGEAGGECDAKKAPELPSQTSQTAGSTDPGASPTSPSSLLSPEDASDAWTGGRE